jgi:hypothetical protein
MMKYSVEIQCQDNPNVWHPVTEREDNTEAETIARVVTANQHVVTRVVKVYRTTSVVFKPAAQAVVML